MRLFARVQDGEVAEIISLMPGQDVAELYVPSVASQFMPVPIGLTRALHPGWRFDGNAFTPPPAPPPRPPSPVYIPASVLRERMEAAGKWDAMAAILFGLMPTQPGLVFKLLTLGEGVDANDPVARALITQAGADPDVILRTP